MKENATEKLDELDFMLESLLANLKTHSEESLNRPPAPGKWSPLQVMHHLMRSEDLSLRYLKKKLSYDPDLPKAGLLARLRVRLLRAYLRAPFKFNAPANVSAETFPERSSLEEVANQWTANRQDLRQFLDAQPAALFEKEVYRHPFSGRMTLFGMLEFFEAHFRRHRRQIVRSLPAK